MKINCRNLKNHRQWQATIGVSEAKFHKILKMFELCYEKKYNQSMSSAFAALGIENPILENYETSLFFVLFQLKNGLTFDVLGFIFETDGGNAQRNFKRYLEILETALSDAGYTPRREFKEEQEFLAYLETEKELIFDGTELPIERPSDYQDQKETFSGKKKRI